MKNHVINLVLTGIILTLSSNLMAQFPDWNTQGNNIITNEWFGADATSTIPLEIRHDAFRPIVFSTDGAERMRIAEFGNISVGGDVSPNQKFAVMLHNNNAAAAPNFESTAIFAFNQICI